MELVTSSGKAVSHDKFLLYEGMASGALHIPGGALSGNYFLKSYTRWMRNTGPQTFSYTPLKIINPFNSEVSNHVDGNVQEQTISLRKYTTGYLDCKTQKPIYGKGEEVQLALSIPPLNRLQKINCCVTVVSAGGIEVDQGQVTFIGSAMKLNDYRVNYLPDMMGITLSGTLVNAEQLDKPIQSAKLYFSILGDEPDFFSTVTDARGRFVISTPDRTGVVDMFVATDPSVAGGAEVRIDQDFDTGQFPLTAEKFTLTDREHELATQMALQTQLSSVYDQEKPRKTSSPDSTSEGYPLFYGTPAFTILMDDFVTLPTLEEVFINLVPYVVIEVRKGIRSIKINGPNSAISLYPPLIMIDHLPVFDQKVVLGLNPEKIMKIDLINEVYIKGGVAHGGVISIFSRNGDMAGIDLPPHSYFFDFLSFQLVEPKEVSAYAPGDRVPDMRNTICWLDDILLEMGDSQEITFKAPAYPGEYVVLVRGMTGPGEVLSATARFVVE